MTDEDHATTDGERAAAGVGAAGPWRRVRRNDRLCEVSSERTCTLQQDALRRVRGRVTRMMGRGQSSVVRVLMSMWLIVLCVGAGETLA